MDQQDGGGVSWLSDLQLLYIIRGQLLQRTILLSSFPGELDQRRKHGWGQTQQGALPLQVGSGCCWVHAHHGLHYRLIWSLTAATSSTDTHSHSHQQLPALHSVWSWKLHGLWSLNYSSIQHKVHYIYWIHLHMKHTHHLMSARVIWGLKTIMDLAILHVNVQSQLTIIIITNKI